MLVRDYVHDMILNQKWAIETDADFYEYDQFWKHCPFLDCEVKYIFTWFDILVLVIDRGEK